MPSGVGRSSAWSVTTSGAARSAVRSGPSIRSATHVPRSASPSQARSNRSQLNPSAPAEIIRRRDGIAVHGSRRTAASPGLE
jgi:hypothetical protein